MSDPAATTAASTAPAASSGSSVTTTPATTVPTDAGGHAGILRPTKITIQALTFNSDCGWPVELKLDSGKGNWQEWDKRLRFICFQRGFRIYLDGTLPRPDESIYPDAVCAWDLSDEALRGFIF